MKKNAMIGIALMLCISALVISPVSAENDFGIDENSIEYQWLDHVIGTGPMALERAHTIIGILADQGCDVSELKHQYIHAKAAYHRASFYFGNGDFIKAGNWANQFDICFYDMIWEVCDLAGVNGLFSGIEHAYFATFSL